MTAPVFTRLVTSDSELSTLDLYAHVPVDSNNYFQEPVRVVVARNANVIKVSSPILVVVVMKFLSWSATKHAWAALYFSSGKQSSGVLTSILFSQFSRCLLELHGSPSALVCQFAQVAVVVVTEPLAHTADLTPLKVFSATHPFLCGPSLNDSGTVGAMRVSERVWFLSASAGGGQSELAGISPKRATGPTYSVLNTDW